MPLRVLGPRMVLEEGVLVLGAGLRVAPVAVKNVLTGFDELPRVCHGAIVDGVRGDRGIVSHLPDLISALKIPK